jgi:hypothetical protein
MKDLIIFGDSYSTYEGHIPAGYAVYYSGHRESPPDVSSVDKTWWHLLANETGANIVQNNSWSGSTIGFTGYNNSDNSHGNSFIYRFEKLWDEGFFEKNDIDTVLVFGGTNDSWSNAPLGELKYDVDDRAELYNVLPAIAYFAKILKERLPKADIRFIVNTEIKSEITEGMKEVCEHYGLKTIALANIDKVNGHPTELGMEQIKDQVKAAL